MSAYFAKIVDNVVEYVTRLEYETILDENGNENDELGITHIKRTIGNDSDFWLRTYRDGEKRAYYAAIGYTYDQDRDIFIPPQPFGSWIFNEETLIWMPPTPKPPHDDNIIYNWNEETLSWDSITMDNN